MSLNKHDFVLNFLPIAFCSSSSFSPLNYPLLFTSSLFWEGCELTNVLKFQLNIFFFFEFFLKLFRNLKLQSFRSEESKWWLNNYVESIWICICLIKGTWLFIVEKVKYKGEILQEFRKVLYKRGFILFYVK